VVSGLRLERRRSDHGSRSYTRDALRFILLEHEIDFAAWAALKGWAEPTRLDAWDFSLRRTAEAEIFLMTDHLGIRSAIERTTETGISLSIEAKKHLAGSSTDAQLEEFRKVHARSLSAFEQQAKDAISNRSVITRRRRAKAKPNEPGTAITC
jgi:hypothetical protein